MGHVFQDAGCHKDAQPTMVLFLPRMRTASETRLCQAEALPLALSVPILAGICLMKVCEVHVRHEEAETAP